MVTRVKLIGLDFGSTTSRAVVASASLLRNAATGRSELAELLEEPGSPVIFTPFDGPDLDLPALEAFLDEALPEGRAPPEETFGGGAVVTGLAARAPNAPGLLRLVRKRLGEALVATAEDPCLESWLAFMGNCHALSRAHPGAALLNLDIGGGTTNLALGAGGEVLRTGSLFVGARHYQFEPGTYRILRLSEHALRLDEHLGLRKQPGDTLDPPEVDAVLDFYTDLLQAAVQGRLERFAEPAAAFHQQVPFRLIPDMPPPALTFSGGVGELVYRQLRGEPLPPATFYGDLGIDLARRIAGRMASDASGCERHERTPAGNGLWKRTGPTGRATVYGLLRHSTQVSGSTLFLPRPEVLPLRDLPILGTLTAASSAEDVDALVSLARRSARGAGIQVRLGESGLAGVQTLGRRLRAALEAAAFPAGQPLVLLVAENLGKVLGGYATGWGALPVPLLVVDEIAFQDAQFAQIGRLQEQFLPVSFFGMNPGGPSP